MMRSGRASSPDVESSFVDIEGALAALSAEGLRELILDILPWLEEPALGRLINGLMDRAARGDSGWAPDGPTGRDVASIVSFADAAARDGYADPTIVDDYLRCGSNAFFAKDYESAVKIFGVLLERGIDGSDWSGTPPRAPRLTTPEPVDVLKRSGAGAPSESPDADRHARGHA